MPSKVYKNVLITGAKEHLMPAEYVQKLENHPDNGYEGEVDVKLDFNRTNWWKWPLFCLIPMTLSWELKFRDKNRTICNSVQQWELDIFFFDEKILGILLQTLCETILCVLKLLLLLRKCVMITRLFTDTSNIYFHPLWIIASN